MKILRKSINYSIFFFSFSYSSQLPQGFVYIIDLVPNIKIDLKYYTNDNFVGERINGYNAPVAISTKETAMALKEIQKDLKHFNYGLKIFDCYRPQQAVDHFVRWSNNNNRKMKYSHYPNVKKINLFKEGYIASKSGHTRGSTVDLTIIDLDSGKELDMGTIYDYFGKESWIEYTGLTFHQKQNHTIKNSLMENLN